MILVLDAKFARQIINSIYNNRFLLLAKEELVKIISRRLVW